MATQASATFRAKTNFMKSWRPRNPPSNRDRLELYALHKQSVSGDAPPVEDQATSGTTTNNATMSAADRAKRNAWRTKRGISRDDAMALYVSECDRQIRTYGDHNNRDNLRREYTDDNNTAIGGGASSGAGTPRGPTTPLNTPAASSSPPDHYDEEEDDGSVRLVCPRGLAAVPLLCAAASESRSAYLARLQVTDPTNGWWAKQEPLCLEMTNPLSVPEKLIISLAERVERTSLVVSNYMGNADKPVGAWMSPRVLQAFLWPAHNVLLCCWISLILTTTCLGSMVVMCRTLLLGAKRTDAPLGRLFAEEVRPSARAVESLCEEHQAVGVRVAGLALMPLMMLCDLAAGVVGRAGTLAGSLVFVGAGACGWWYWACVLPWLAVCGLCLAVMSGWCFGLIELAGQ